MEDRVSQFRVVPCDVSESPDSLFSNVGLVFGDDLEEGLKSVFVDDGLALGGSSAGDVGENPCGL